MFVGEVGNVGKAVILSVNGKLLRKGGEKRKVSQNPFRSEVVVQNFGGAALFSCF